jgi:hypothetical protein
MVRTSRTINLILCGFLILSMFSLIGTESEDESSNLSEVFHYVGKTWNQRNDEIHLYPLEATTLNIYNKDGLVSGPINIGAAARYRYVLHTSNFPDVYYLRVESSSSISMVVIDNIGMTEGLDMGIASPQPQMHSKYYLTNYIGSAENHSVRLYSPADTKCRFYDQNGNMVSEKDVMANTPVEYGLMDLGFSDVYGITVEGDSDFAISFSQSGPSAGVFVPQSDRTISRTYHLVGADDGSTDDELDMFAINDCTVRLYDEDNTILVERTVSAGTVFGYHLDSILPHSDAYYVKVDSTQPLVVNFKDRMVDAHESGLAVPQNKLHDAFYIPGAWSSQFDDYMRIYSPQNTTVSFHALDNSNIWRSTSVSLGAGEVVEYVASDFTPVVPYGYNIRIESTNPIAFSFLEGSYSHDGTFVGATGLTIPMYILSVPLIADAGLDQTVLEGDVVTFQGSSSGGSSDFFWDFDSGFDSDSDGDPANDVDATGPTPTHIYGDNGEFVVTLTVLDNMNQSSMDTCNITVLNVDPSVTIESMGMDVEIGLRVAGRKFNDVGMTIMENEKISGYVSIERMPGSPDDQMAWLPVSVNLSRTYSAVVTYLPEDPPNVGANPVWIYLRSPNGSISKIHHTFNVKQSKEKGSVHWNHVEPWEVELNEHFIGLPFEVRAHVEDPGSDDVVLSYSYGTQVVNVSYPNDPPDPDPLPSPEVNPRDIYDSTMLLYEGPGTLDLLVSDDDGGTGAVTVDI